MKLYKNDIFALARLITLLFVVLKLTGFISWSWFWVFSPIIFLLIPIALFFAFALVVLLIVIIND